MKIPNITGVMLLLIFFGNTPASSQPIFSFESVVSLEDMHSLIRSNFPLETPRTDIQHAFVDEGQATLIALPGSSDVEKYLYDINLCNYYIWRWNISADYDANDLLRQAYVNGNIVFPEGTPQRIVPKTAEEGKKSAIYRIQRPRPEAHMGETSLGFMLFDRDSDRTTTDDQALIGFGPSRVDPKSMGKMIDYSDIDPWRSIFDFDAADRIVPYTGGCE